jgi:hypothetical protein
LPVAGDDADPGGFVKLFFTALDKRSDTGSRFCSGLDSLWFAIIGLRDLLSKFSFSSVLQLTRSFISFVGDEGGGTLFVSCVNFRFEASGDGTWTAVVVLTAESNVGPCVNAASDGGELTDVGLERITSFTSISGLEWPMVRLVWPEIERELE